jgi:peroxiredoxin
MLSSERRARFGLVAVAVVFFLALGVLGSKAIERQLDRANSAADFTLPEVDGQTVSLASLQGKTVVLVFWSARGPVTNEYSQRVIRLAGAYASDDRVAVVTIDPTLTDLNPCVLNEVRVFKNVIHQPFPLLIDVGGKVAEQYGVQVTPTVVVIDKGGRIRYCGAFDDNQKEAAVSKTYCADAVASLLEERPITTTFTQAFGRPIRQPK